MKEPHCRRVTVGPPNAILLGYGSTCLSGGVCEIFMLTGCSRPLILPCDAFMFCTRLGQITHRMERI
jgi:hypothetical protein